jgi:branched-chain amino acid transport system permease protein
MDVPVYLQGLLIGVDETRREYRMQDRQAEVWSRFEVEARARAVSLVDDDLIAEHGANPHGPHSARLESVMNYMRRAPTRDKYVIVASEPWNDYRIAELSEVRGRRLGALSEESFPTEEIAMHAVFLRRVDEMLRAS